MIVLTVLCLFVAAVYSAPAPGFDYDFSHSLYDDHAPIISEPILKSYVHHEPTILKTYAPAPIYKTFAHAPIIKAAPIIKTITPATSYASFTQYQISHAPVIKTVAVAAPHIVKTYASPLHLDHLDHYYH